MADTVQRLRWRGGAGADAVAQRHRAEASVAGGLPTPRGLPAGALLCVRQLSLRLPHGALSAVAHRAAPQLQRQLDQAWAQAVRPGPGSPGAAVPALWFADAAELLVFLARRARAADTAAWWWPALAGRVAEPRAAVAGAWLHQAPAVPVAVQALGGEALAVCAWIGPSACDEVARAVARVYRVSAVTAQGGVSVVAPPQDATAVGAGSTSPAQASAATAPPFAQGARSNVPANRSQTADSPEVAPPHPDIATPGAMSPAARLVALGRRLAREPWSATGADFGAQVEREAWALVGSDGVATRPAQGDERAPARAADPVARLNGRPRARPRPSPPRPAREAVDLPAESRRPHDTADPPPTATTEVRSRCHTPHAGLFFLVPLLQQQGCLGDFTQPQPDGAAVHPAWLLLALWRRLADRRQPDALPMLLKAWAGAARPPRGAMPARPAFEALVRALQADAARRLQRPVRGSLAWLVRQPGWVRLGLSRLDVGFDLERHPFAIRAAGLDRDVGWLPAGGRHLAFHFETGPGASGFAA